MQRPTLISASMLAALALAALPTLASAQSTSDKVEQKLDKAKTTVQEKVDQAAEKTDRMGEKLQQKTDRMVDKVEQKADKAAEKTDMKGDAGIKGDVSDAWLTSKTKIALFGDERVKGRQVSVETKNGTVMLRGKVDSAEAKASAESIAKSIEGVKSVKNELQVVAPAERKAVQADDKDLTKAVKDRLKSDPQMKKIDVRVDSGVVILSGEVDSIAASARASEVARSVPGVRSVKNDVTYKDTRGALRSEPDRRVTRMEPAMPVDKRDDRLTSDRAVTRDTRESLRTERRADGPTAGSQQHMRVMQEKLKDSGYDPGPIDGVMGPQTAAALKEYQKAEGLRVTGQADTQTLGKLGIGVGGSVSPGPTPTDPQATPEAQRKKQSP